MADFLESQVDYNYYEYTKDPEYIALIESHIEDLKQKFDLSVTNVSIVTTNIPVVWAKLLSDCKCNVKIIGNHPIMLASKDILETIDYVKVHKANIFIDQLDFIIDDDDLVIFPDFEFYMPLDKVKYDLTRTNILVVNCFKDPHWEDGIGINQPNFTNNIEQFRQQVDCKEVKHLKHFKYKDRDYFYFMSDREIKSGPIVKFITMKWGKKYGPEYVNRLYNCIKRTYSDRFKFYCVTDDTTGLDKRINTLTFEDVGYYESSKCFTIQKMFLFKKGILPFGGPYVCLDLDTLILKDLKPYFDEYQFKEGRFIKNYWESIEGCRHQTFFGACWLNSSFVTWDGDQLDHVYQFYVDHKEAIEWKYQDLDWFLWNTILDDLNFHPPKIVYAYSFGAYHPDDMEKYKFRDDYLMAIFNTSHGEGVELDEADGWVKEYWS